MLRMRNVAVAIPECAVESMMNHREILSVPVYRKQQSVKYVQFWLF